MLKNKVNIFLSIISIIISIISLVVVLNEKNYINIFSKKHDNTEYSKNEEFLNKNEMITFNSIDERLNFLTKNKDLYPYCEKGYIYSLFKDICLTFINPMDKNIYEENFFNVSYVHFDKSKSIEENCKNKNITKEEGCIDGFIYLFSISDEFSFGLNTEKKLIVFEKNKVAEIKNIKEKKI